MGRAPLGRDNDDKTHSIVSKTFPTNFTYTTSSHLNAAPEAVPRLKESLSSSDGSIKSDNLSVISIIPDTPIDILSDNITSGVSKTRAGFGLSSTAQFTNPGRVNVAGCSDKVSINSFRSPSNKYPRNTASPPIDIDSGTGSSPQHYLHKNPPPGGIGSSPHPPEVDAPGVPNTQVHRGLDKTRLVSSTTPSHKVATTISFTAEPAKITSCALAHHDIQAPNNQPAKSLLPLIRRYMQPSIFRNSLPTTIV